MKIDIGQVCRIITEIVLCDGHGCYRDRRAEPGEQVVCARILASGIHKFMSLDGLIASVPSGVLHTTIEPIE